MPTEHHDLALVAARSPPLRVMRFSGARFEGGVEEHEIEGISVRVCEVAKAVVDLFRYRNKVGLDVALEALREARRDGRCSLAERTSHARAAGALTPMRPYLEAI